MGMWQKPGTRMLDGMGSGRQNPAVVRWQGLSEDSLSLALDTIKFSKEAVPLSLGLGWGLPFPYVHSQVRKVEVRALSTDI